MDITVYDRSAQVGGRAQTANLYSTPWKYVEAGAEAFSTKDLVLTSLIRSVGLQVSVRNYAWDETAVWDGAEFIDRWKGARWSSWNLGRAVWKFGSTVLGLRNLFRQAGDGNRCLQSSQVSLRGCGLSNATDKHAIDYLSAKGILPDAMEAIVWPSIRETYAQDRESVHGLAAVLSMDEEQRLFLERGIRRVFERVITLANANLKLNTEVTKITRNANGSVSVQSAPAKQDGTVTTSGDAALYDAVVIATPFYLANIAQDPPLPITPDPTPVVERHVTLFASKYRVSPAAFSLSAGATVPDRVLTTGSAAHPPDFFSLSRRDVRFKDGCVVAPEHLYRLVTAAPVSDARVAALLGLPADDPDALARQVWIHRAAWPQAELRPRAEFEAVALADRVFYAGGADAVLSSLEAGAIMGRHVARTLYDRLWQPDLEP